MSGIENRTVIIRRKLRMLASHRHGGGPKPGVRNLGFREGAAAFGQNLGHARQPPGRNWFDRSQDCEVTKPHPRD